jgi:starch phosphorylase
MEASGTSGQKASANGVLNLSVLDGWWFEGFNGQNGWAVEEKGGGDPEATDNQTAKSIYDLLEEQIIPLYYERDAEGLPRGWIRMMKETMRSNSPLFNTSRMAKEYTDLFYLKAIHNQHK